MKKLIAAVSALVFCLSLSAFDARNHAAIAYIAEQNITPRTKAKIAEIFHGEHLYVFSSWPDYYRSTMLIDKAQIPHGVRLDEQLMPNNSLKSAYPAFLAACERLKDYRNRPDSANIADLSIVVHLVGDMHCPSHMYYSGKTVKKVKNVLYSAGGNASKPEKISYHSFWDGIAMNKIFLGGFMDIASLSDNCSRKEIREIQKGTMEDWIHESAVNCLQIYDIKENEHIDKDYVIKSTFLSMCQIRKAGYRLAKVLNDLFK